MAALSDASQSFVEYWLSIAISLQIYQTHDKSAKTFVQWMATQIFELKASVDTIPAEIVNKHVLTEPS